MNTEQLRAEFEAWWQVARMNRSGIAPNYGDMVTNCQFEAYQAAAKSRDGLIGKLHTACLAADAVWIGNDTVTNNMARQLNREALAEAKAQGYGE